MKPIAYILALCLFAGCDMQEKERLLQQRQDSLNRREQELLLREKTVSLKEEAIQAASRDPVPVIDSTAQMVPAVAGLWNVRMTCIEAGCPGSALGDLKQEQWELSYQGAVLVARAMTDKKLVRVYTGGFRGDELELTQDREASPSEGPTRMVVRLRRTDSTTMQGQREILRETNCKVLYEVKMDKL